MIQPPRPSEFELAILTVLWKRGEATVRQIHEDLTKERPMVYTTVLKTMQIMLEKGLLARDESERSHVYRPTLREQETQANFMRDMLARVFGGSGRKLVMAALSEAPMTKEEAEEIKALLERKKKPAKS
jgi:BlaI family transcriptional regulator, penicillinase repressor